MFSPMNRAIVRKPTSSFLRGLTTANLGVPCHERALQQHRAYCEALEQSGLALFHLNPDDRYPDSTFVEDTAILFGDCAVLARPGAASRAGEVSAVADVLSQFYSQMETIKAPGCLDGGDICEAGNHYFIGISQRTNEVGARQLREFLSARGHSCSLVDIRSVKGLLHLKSGLASLGDNRLVVTEALAGLKEFAAYELLGIASDEEYAANCIRINDSVLIAKGYSKFASALANLGYRTIELEMSEFQKMDGGLSCLSLRF